jgi:hypothetical protein
MKTSEDILRVCRDRLADGADVEAVIRILRDSGLSKVRSIIALIDLDLANLSEAKIVIHNSPTWDDVRERDEELHRQIEENLHLLIEP